MALGTERPEYDLQGIQSDAARVIISSSTLLHPLILLTSSSSCIIRGWSFRPGLIPSRGSIKYLFMAPNLREISIPCLAPLHELANHSGKRWWRCDEQCHVNFVGRADEISQPTAVNGEWLMRFLADYPSCTSPLLSLSLVKSMNAKFYERFFAGAAKT